MSICSKPQLWQWRLVMDYRKDRLERWLICQIQGDHWLAKAPFHSTIQGSQKRARGHKKNSRGSRLTHGKCRDNWYSMLQAMRVNVNVKETILGADRYVCSINVHYTVTTDIMHIYCKFSTDHFVFNAIFPALLGSFASIFKAEFQQKMTSICSENITIQNTVH